MVTNYSTLSHYQHSDRIPPAGVLLCGYRSGARVFTYLYARGLLLQFHSRFSLSTRRDLEHLYSFHSRPTTNSCQFPRLFRQTIYVETH